MKVFYFTCLFSLLHLSPFLLTALAAPAPSPPIPGRCGSQGGGALCRPGFCCSNFGWCGSTDPYCAPGNCQSQCPSPTPPPPPPTPGRCGSQGGGALCHPGFCCSNFGWCGSTDHYCAPGNCQSQCPIPGPPPPTPAPPPPTPTPGTGIESVISSSMFDEMLMHRNNVACPGKGFYTYSAFVTAANSFPGFGTTGDIDTRKREVAAFFAQTSHETTGGWLTAPDGPFAWGYCFVREVDQSWDYCSPNAQWPCAPGRKYFGRGPIQISYNYNYGPCGEAIGVDLLNNPDLVATDPVISFKSAIWFWMTTQLPKPSCHDVIIGKWTPSPADLSANRLPGFGLLTNIINGGLECGIGYDPRVQSRIGFYKRYCSMFGVSPGDNLDCGNQRPFGFGLLLDTM